LHHGFDETDIRHGQASATLHKGQLPTRWYASICEVCHSFPAVSRLCWPRTIVGRHLAIGMFPCPNSDHRVTDNYLADAGVDLLLRAKVYR
jgi:hypothetical protein